MKILFITFTNIGDVILSSVLLDRILASHPDATVDIVAGGKSVELFAGLPNLGELIPLIKKKHHSHYWDLWKKLRGREYDLVVDLRTPLLTKFIKAKKVIKYRPNKDSHKAQQLAKLWPSREPIQAKIWLPEDIINKVDNYLNDHFKHIVNGCKPLIAIAPTANWIGKRWPQKNFAMLLAELRKIEGYNNACFAIFGAEHERHTVADFINYIPTEHCIDLVGKTSLIEAYAWLKKADLFIGNDSGLAHMAAAAEVPMVTLFGPTCEKIYAPVSYSGKIITPVACNNVNLEPEAPKRLITDITPQMIAEAVQKLFERKNSTEGQQEAC